MKYNEGIREVFPNKIIILTLAIILFVLIFFLGFPLWLDITLISIIFFIFKNFFQYLFSSLAIILIIIISNFILGHEIENIFFRPHEKYSLNKIYQKNLSVVMTMNHGDLYAMDNANIFERELIKEKRSVEFITDNHGFRNNLFKIEDSDIILVGDSFIVGNGTDQKDIPANQLSKLTGLKVSSIAYASTPVHYEKMLLKLIDHLKKNARIIIFYFEGNDFVNIYKKLSKKDFWALKYVNLEREKDKILNKVHSKKNLFIRKVRRNSHFLNRKIFSLSSLNPVKYHKIGNNIMGFYNPHSLEKGRTYIIRNKKILSKTLGVFLMPTKTSTYSKFIKKKLNSFHTNLLREQYEISNIPVINLTESFIQHAQLKLSEGKYLFWRDDTHWNSDGIKVGMECVAKFIVIQRNSSNSQRQPWQGCSSPLVK
jgi:hypothetical protein